MLMNTAKLLEHELSKKNMYNQLLGIFSAEHSLFGAQERYDKLVDAHSCGRCCKLKSPWLCGGWNPCWRRTDSPWKGSPKWPGSARCGCRWRGGSSPPPERQKPSQMLLDTHNRLVLLTFWLMSMISMSSRFRKRLKHSSTSPMLVSVGRKSKRE